MKKILIFSTAYLPFIGGAEVAVKEITDKLGDENATYSFDLITARLDKKLAAKERIGLIDVFRVGSGRRFDKFLLPFSGLQLALKLYREKKIRYNYGRYGQSSRYSRGFFKDPETRYKIAG